MKVGNNILFEGKPCKIIDINGLVYKVRKNESREVCYTVLSKLQGIYLTNEILSSLSFVKNYRWWINCELKILSLTIATMKAYYFKGKRIKYVHELEDIIKEK